MLEIFILSLFPVFLYLIFKSRKALHMLQQNWYDKDYRYFKWILKNPYRVFLENDMTFIIFTAFLFLDSKISIFIFSVYYLLITYFYLQRIKKEQAKKPLVVTKRIRRLYVTILILYLIPAVTIALTFNIYYLTYYYLIIGALVYLNYFVIMVANIFNKPFEKHVYHYYRIKAMKKLKNMPHLKVIGITGSYGKTSSKNILSDILNIRYNAFPTPKNFNTPYGLINMINNYLDKFSEFLIAEMGAFKTGEIKELCDLVHPTYGILTTIGTAHLESFGSRENIQKTKFELIESLPNDGVAVLNADDEYQLSYELKNKCKVIWIGIDNKDADVVATNIKLSHNGTTFDCLFKGDKNKYKFETRLLGKANIYNILASIALGKELGLTIEQLQMGVLKVKPIEHRLELKRYGDINIIDDAYNSNPVGSKMALDVLNLMLGKKIIVTPGMIELGSEQYELNLEFGKQIADVCDEVILVGRKQTKPIYDGLMIKDYNEKHIYVINDVKEAIELMQKLKGKETYVLLENDLPDIFNERK